MESKVKIFIALFALLVAEIFSSENQLEGFALPFPIHDAVLFDGSLYLATSQGVRQVSSDGTSVFFTSEDGLETSHFVSVKANENALYAVSRQGTIARKKKGENKFHVINRSFQEKGIFAIPTLAAITENVMVIAFEKKLSFFDLDSEEFIMSISRIGTSDLEGTPIQALTIHGDSLLVAIEKNLYSRKMEWNNLKKDKLLADPASWKHRQLDTTPYALAIDNSGKLHFKEQKGTYIWGKDLLFSASEDTSALVVNGKKVKPKSFYKNDTSLVNWILPHEGKYFFVGQNFVAYGLTNESKNFSEWSSYQLGPVYELTTLPSGGIVASGNNSMLSFIGPKDKTFSLPMPSNPLGWSNAFDGPNHLMKTLSVLPNNKMYYGIWGLGGTIFENFHSPNVQAFFQASMETCMENFLENYWVSASAVAAPDGSGFLISYWGKEAYGLAFMNLYGDILCAPSVGSSSFSGPMLARKAEDSSDWEVFVSSGTTAALNGTGSIDKFIIEPPSRSGFSLKVLEKKSISTPEKGFVLDMAFDAENRLWGVTYSNIGFLEDNDTLRVPHRISQFAASSFSSIAIDPQGNPWVSSNGQGVFRLQKIRNSVDTLSAKRFRVRDGLLSENVFDIALDSITGTIWFAQDLGITSLKRNDLRQASSFMTDSASSEVKVYPNPFRPELHQKIIFDYISESSRVNIFNAGGKLVRSFSGESLQGGRLEWDARDDSGNLVAPGLYHYFIKKGKKQKKGKLLIVY